MRRSGLGYTIVRPGPLQVSLKHLTDISEFSSNSLWALYISSILGIYIELTWKQYRYLCFIQHDCMITVTIPLILFQEEPGGQRALIFDQGNRISQVKCHEALIVSVMPKYADHMLYGTLYLLTFLCRVLVVLM